jgi:catechol 2,3-dioxygenase-like lactoylglutathione lyase family enzyme
MISGAHVILYSQNAEADRKFFNDIFGFGSVDAGGGWLIFRLPPAELAFHPADEHRNELYLMCDDLETTRAGLQRKGVVFKGDIQEQSWGRLAHIELPSGGVLGIYQPKHPLPPPAPITKD